MKTTLIALSTLVLFSCGSDEIVINTFNQFPDNIGGPGCEYSTNPTAFEKNEFVFVDGEGTAYMKINGKNEVLEFVEYTTTKKFGREFYKNADFEVIIARRIHNHPIEVTSENVTSELVDDYLSKSDASITVKSGGKTTSIKVVGECSCC